MGAVNSKTLFLAAVPTDGAHVRVVGPGFSTVTHVRMCGTIHITAANERIDPAFVTEVMRSQRARLAPLPPTPRCVASHGTDAEAAWLQLAGEVDARVRGGPGTCDCSGPDCHQTAYFIAALFAVCVGFTLSMMGGLFGTVELLIPGLVLLLASIGGWYMFWSLERTLRAMLDQALTDADVLAARATQQWAVRGWQLAASVRRMNFKTAAPTALSDGTLTDAAASDSSETVSGCCGSAVPCYWVLEVRPSFVPARGVAVTTGLPHPAPAAGAPGGEDPAALAAHGTGSHHVAVSVSDGAHGAHEAHHRDHTGRDARTVHPAVQSDGAVAGAVRSGVGSVDDDTYATAGAAAAAAGVGVAAVAASSHTAGGIVAAGADALEMLGEAAPIFGAAFKLIGRVRHLCHTAQANKDNCALVGERVASLDPALRAITRHFTSTSAAGSGGGGGGGGPSGPAPLVPAQRGAIDRVVRHLQELEQLVGQYQDRGWITARLSAGRFKESFEACDANITRALEDLHVGMAAELVAQNDALLAASRVTLTIDAKVDALLEQQSRQSDDLARINDNLSALMAMLGTSASGSGSGSGSGATGMSHGGGSGGDADASAVAADIEYVVPFGELSIGDEIGSGGFGTVSKASWHGTTVAVKELTLKGNAMSRRLLAEINREAWVMSQLRHPNIAGCFGIAVHRPTLYLVLEFMAGGSLDALLQDDGMDLPWRLRVGLVRQAASGLHHLHSRPAPKGPIVHGDIKSSNMLLTEHAPSARLVLADFGLAKVKVATGASTTGGSGGGPAGTLRWMAPELLTGRSGRSMEADVYALGVVMSEVVTRDLPWADQGEALVPSLVKDGVRPPLPADTPPDFAALIAECWAQDPAARPDAAAIVARCDEIIDSDEVRRRG